jgi:hypothetical protein
VTSTFAGPPLEPGEIPCIRCGDRSASEARLSFAGQRGWCWVCAKRYLDDLAADFPGNKRILHPEPVGEQVYHTTSRAVMKRHEAETRRWLRYQHASASLEWHGFYGREWGNRSPESRMLAYVAHFPQGMPTRFISSPWAYASSPAMNQPHAIASWLIWEQGKDGYLEGVWTPDEGPDWIVRRLRPDAFADRKRLLNLVIRDEGDPEVRSGLVEAVLAFRAANDGKNPGRGNLGTMLYITPWAVDKRCQEAGVQHLKGLLSFVDSLQKLQRRH